MTRSPDFPLSSLVPPLAHTRDDLVRHALHDGSLPQHRWWNRVRLPLVLDRTGAEKLADGLARLTAQRWGGHCPGEVMPALYLTGEEAFVGSPVWRLLQAKGEEAAVEELAAQFRRVLEQIPVERACREQASDTPAFMEEIEAWCLNAPDRKRSIAVQRLFTRPPVALDQVAGELGVTRTWARQVQKRTADELAAWAEGPLGRATSEHLRKVEAALGSAAPAKAFWDLCPEHRATLPTLGVPAGDAVLALLPHHWTRDGWVTTLRSSTLEQTIAMRLRERSVLPLDEVESTLVEGGIRLEHVPAWLDALPLSKVMDGHVVSWRRSVADKAAAVLTLVGSPLSFDTLAEGIGGDYSMAGVRSRIRADRRFQLVDRKVVGLRCWGGQEYPGLADSMRREIEAAGGSVDMNVLVDRVTQKYDISESSIRSTGYGPEFTRSKDGRIGMAGAFSPEEELRYRPRRPVERARRCFRDPEGTWWFRVDLNREHLRGSGFPVPAGFAAACGLRPGERRPVTVGERGSYVTWKSYPSMSSIRTALLGTGALEGDHAFVTLAEGTVRVRVRRAHLAPRDGLRRALYLAGLDADGEGDALPKVSALMPAVGLQPEATVLDLLERLDVRGDTDLYGLVRGVGV
ncbi:RNA polymerase subunit sigma-70 [Nocardiopsis sp. HNM0947]|uniref:RNA polymerase subunit sigma-70 n=1 Tax=Nocardiopsis coralli TaxID=2772213 RepID=A0ABR9P1F8_9ACTN|nr:RNA polymerase subunit sigma-70 [Nocardiopsis coralli]MBE2997686.1 RNA polymerase subunit sigma-70 [Nocardiopsis coralli]